MVSLPPDPDKVVEIWTDGGCRPNPGPAAGRAILTFRNVVKELSGAEAMTTNNRMELTAAAVALEALKRPCHVVIHTDSQYREERHHSLGDRLDAQGLETMPPAIRWQTSICGSASWRRRRYIGWNGSWVHAAMTATT